MLQSGSQSHRHDTGFRLGIQHVLAALNLCCYLKEPGPLLRPLVTSGAYAPYAWSSVSDFSAVQHQGQICTKLSRWARAHSRMDSISNLHTCTDIRTGRSTSISMSELQAGMCKQCTIGKVDYWSRSCICT